MYGPHGRCTSVSLFFSASRVPPRCFPTNQIRFLKHKLNFDIVMMMSTIVKMLATDCRKQDQPDDVLVLVLVLTQAASSPRANCDSVYVSLL